MDLALNCNVIQVEALCSVKGRYQIRLDAFSFTLIKRKNLNFRWFHILRNRDMQNRSHVLRDMWQLINAKRWFCFISYCSSSTDMKNTKDELKLKMYLVRYTLPLYVYVYTSIFCYSSFQGSCQLYEVI